MKDLQAQVETLKAENMQLRHQLEQAEARATEALQAGKATNTPADQLAEEAAPKKVKRTPVHRVACKYCGKRFKSVGRCMVNHMRHQHDLPLKAGECLKNLQIVRAEHAVTLDAERQTAGAAGTPGPGMAE